MLPEEVSQRHKTRGGDANLRVPNKSIGALISIGYPKGPKDFGSTHHEEVCVQREGQDQFVTVDEVMRMLSIGKNKAYDILSSGEISAVRLGRTVRVNKASLLDFIEKHPYAREDYS